mgnify:CR=1 FL=1
MSETIKNSISLEEIYKAQQSIKGVVQATPLVFMKNFSEYYNANIYFKREDLQVVRSYKIRGAYNKIQGLSKEQLQNGIVCASAGNHAQGVAYACKKLQVKGVVFMPYTTPHQKIDQVKMFGGEFVEIKLFGDSFDDTHQFTGSLHISDESSNFSIIGNGFGQTSLISPDGALVLTPGIYGVQINGAFPDLKVNGNNTLYNILDYLFAKL